ncbi:Dolichyl-phosphate-mannose-protein mannosyltransferase [Thalassobacillus cyri]|uniref:Dolichyl-phosphate-mannose-protein mannosyltransferase n=1 Tax=Thalassobacillus cyri TaxID=571932 RepID=A0A1H3ZPP0_9BACI|nr:glycosyltransferase family 39 protein [Thalassobacillus cyri]SEA25351.1 Dolichyl-phosphate-mannose-protein mannosyltransferase [Thalassobacillus cyri]
MNKAGFPTNRKNFLAWAAFLAFIGLTLFFRLLYVSPFARSWDQVDFALGVTDFDLYTMQPHFPGYPYFVLGGMLINGFLDDPARALSIFNSLLTASSVIPMYLLFRRHYVTTSALLFVAVTHSMSYMWVMSTEPMSEAAAVAVLWWYIWSLYQACTKSSFYWMLLPLLLFSILTGTRLSYLPFGLGILLLWWNKRDQFDTRKSYIRFILKHTLLAIAFQLVWVAGLVLSTGGLGTFTDLAFGFVNGHFTEWGGAVTVDSVPLWKRIYILLFHNLLWKAWFVEAWPIAGLYTGLIILVVFLSIKNKVNIKNFDRWLLVLWICYFLWALFAQNVEKPRHILPLTGLSVYLLFVNLAGRVKLLTVSLCLVLITIQSWQGLALAKEKATEPPAVYQLSNYLSQLEEPMIIYTWEESRVMEYLDIGFSYKKLYTYDYFQSRLSYSKEKRVFLTDHVVKGFEIQGHKVQDKIRKVAVFQSEDLFDPVYNDIQLYEWLGE